MKTQVFLITPPFTQLNTHYPATAYIKGFLNTKNIQATEADLGIEVIFEIVSENKGKVLKHYRFKLKCPLYSSPLALVTINQ